MDKNLKKRIDELMKIKSFLDGHNDDIKYLVNVEADPNVNYAKCFIHKPGEKKRVIEVEYEPFMYMKNLSKFGIELYPEYNDEQKKSKMHQFGIDIQPLKTGGHKRLVDGYCYKLTSTKSYNSIISFLKEGGFNPYEKKYDEDGRVARDEKGRIIYPNRNYFYAPKYEEQFFISTGIRLFKGIEEYNDIHKLTFDIETTGLRYESTRVFAIGVRDNRGFEKVIEVDKLDDDASERKIIKEFIDTYLELQPAIISGYNSEEFDFEYLIGRANKRLDFDLEKIQTTFNKKIPMKRIPNMSVKYGNTADKYTATKIWGTSVIDIMHAAKKTAAINTDLKNTKLKYICKFENIAKPNRTYIDGDEGKIGKMYVENKIHMINEDNDYVCLPDSLQEIGEILYALFKERNKQKIDAETYKTKRNKVLKTKQGKEFVDWFMKHAKPKNRVIFISGREILRNYLLDDLWETEQVDELYNQTSFMLAKIIPTTYQRICTMGTAAIWELLLTAWSYEHDLAIPHPDKKVKFSGGLARCFKRGYSEDIVKIDYNSLYPLLQLTDDVFPIFDITGVMKMMLTYLTTTRNIYKKIAKDIKLNDLEEVLFELIDTDLFKKFNEDMITKKDRGRAKVKQSPIKVLNNSQFGSLGSDVSFKWSDNICAARITCLGRLELRRAIDWFPKFGCVPLLAVTDGVNFQMPKETNIVITDNETYVGDKKGGIDEMWSYGGDNGIDALINKFNAEEMRPPHMEMGNDGVAESCLNLSRINYATMSKTLDKETRKYKTDIKLTGNTIKSKTMPEYIEEFLDNAFELILNGDGVGFVEYYYNYVEDLFYERIPLKKIANKSKMKTTIKGYLNRGTDKNGKPKAKQAHMQLIIKDRERVARELFYEKGIEILRQKNDDFNEKSFKLGEYDLMDLLEYLNNEDKYESLTDQEKEEINNLVFNVVTDYMPPEPELDSTIYYYNVGFRKSHGDVKEIKHPETKKTMFCSKLLRNDDIQKNPDMKDSYNVDKYISAFNERVKTILVGFKPEVAEKILAEVVRKKKKNKYGKSVEHVELVKNQFTNEDLKLQSFDKDSVEEAMFLEPKELGFWNAFGYNPKLVWDGFKESKERRVHTEIYEHALKYLNQKMREQGKPEIKSVNDKTKKGDLILYKFYDKYSLGQNKGKYVKIVREDIQIPKSDYELNLDAENHSVNKKIDDLKSPDMDVKTNDEVSDGLKKSELFVEFKKQFKLPEKMSMSEFYEAVDGGEKMFNEYIEMWEEENTLEFDIDD